MPSTPFDALVHAVQNISWGQVWYGIGASFVFLLGLTWRLAKRASRLDSTQDQVQKMATNDFPHMFHTMVNMDKNIAKMSGGDPVDFTEMDAVNKKVE